MARHTHKQIGAPPNLPGRDTVPIRRACGEIRALPVTIVNFVEGHAPFTPAKAGQQGASFRHLLKPKAGGVASCSTRWARPARILDVTLAFRAAGPRCGTCWRAGFRHLHTRSPAPDPAELLGGDTRTTAPFRVSSSSVERPLWLEKDAEVERFAGGRLGQGVDRAGSARFCSASVRR